MRATTTIVVLLALAAFAAAAPVASADETPRAYCTLSYPGTCTAVVAGERVTCSGVGAVPECG